MLPILTPLFHADPLHRREGWHLVTSKEHFNDNDDDNDISKLTLNQLIIMMILIPIYSHLFSNISKMMMLMMMMMTILNVTDYKLLSSSLSLSYTCSKIAPILTPLFHADPLHPRGGWKKLLPHSILMIMMMIMILINSFNVLKSIFSMMVMMMMMMSYIEWIYTNIQRSKWLYEDYD